MSKSQYFHEARPSHRIVAFFKHTFQSPTNFSIIFPPKPTGPHNNGVDWSPLVPGGGTPRSSYSVSIIINLMCFRERRARFYNPEIAIVAATPRTIMPVETRPDDWWKSNGKISNLISSKFMIDFYCLPGLRTTVVCGERYIRNFPFRLAILHTAFGAL